MTNIKKYVTYLLIISGIVHVLVHVGARMINVESIEIIPAVFGIIYITIGFLSLRTNKTADILAIIMTALGGTGATLQFQAAQYQLITLSFIIVDVLVVTVFSFCIFRKKGIN